MRHWTALIIGVLVGVFVVSVAYRDGATGSGLVVNGVVAGVIVYLVVRFMIRSRRH